MKKTYLLFLILISLSISSPSQISKKFNLIVGAGATYPQESFLANPFVFPQLDRGFQNDVGTNFAGNYFKQDITGTNFKKYWKTVFNVGAGLEFEINDYLTSILLVQYQQFAFNKNELTKGFKKVFADSFGIPFNTAGFDIQNGTVKIYSIALNLKAQYPIKYLTPYIMAGGGYMRLSQEAIDLNYYDEPFSSSPISVSIFDRIPEEKANALMANVGGGLCFNILKRVHPFLEGRYSIGFTNNADPNAKTSGEQKSFNTKYYAISFGFIFNLK
jgi:opacity protein-like surface antigen